MEKKPVILILNGPNLNMLGDREPLIYGKKTIAQIEEDCAKAGEKLRLSVDFRQSNSEGELVTWIQQERNKVAGIIINAAGFTHTSIAIMDALKEVRAPIIEIHLSNVFSREKFRHHSYISPVATGVICGLGPSGYIFALEAIDDINNSI